MSRITGNDAKGLMEAYSAVYTPQELTEEQVWEEVETWVNSLLEEGYDLSDYTWEEMYESYIEEEQLMERGAPTDPKARAAYDAQVAKNRAALGNTILYGNSAGKKPEAPVTRNRNVPGSRTIKPPAGTPTPKFADLRGSNTPGSNTPAIPKVRYPVAGTPPTKTNTPTATKTASTPPTKPTTTAATPAPRPTATAAAQKPAAAPAAKPAGSAMDQWAKANPRLAQAQQIRKQGGSRAEVNKSLYNKGTAAATSTPTVVKAGFDMFDVVKGYLIGEGYADTEEAALAIMINMSEEWRQSIVEERAPGVKPYKAGPTQAEVRADAKRASKKKTEKDKDKEGYGPEEKFKDWKLTSTPSTVSKTGETISQRMDKEAPYKTRPFSPLFTKQGSRTASAVTRATEGPCEPHSVTMPRKKSKPSREIVRKNKDTNESYDYILSHLIYEGYANTVESAEAIISNMSEDWILSIIQ